MKARELMKMLEDSGWTLDRTHGSHHIYVKNGVHVSVPGPANRESSIGIEKLVKRKIKEAK